MTFQRPQQKEMKLWEMDQKKKLRVVWKRDDRKDENRWTFIQVMTDDDSHTGHSGISRPQEFWETSSQSWNLWKTWARKPLTQESEKDLSGHNGTKCFWGNVSKILGGLWDSLINMSFACQKQQWQSRWQGSHCPPLAFSLLWLL